MLVSGGRDYSDRRRVFQVLDFVHELVDTITLVRHGDARGADSLGDAWAKARKVPRDPRPADWYPRPGHFDRRAGFARNMEMARLGADLRIAFPGGNGTAHMVKQAMSYGIPVFQPTT